MKKKIKILIFGQRTKGEKLLPIKPFKERPFNTEDFYKWSVLHNRKPIYLN